MSIPLISVVLPFHNAENTLGEAIDSLRAQTFQEWELVLFDDGSMDGSAALAADRMQSDQRIRMTSSGHLGIAKALQSACMTTRSRYIARMDADDLALPDRLKKQFMLMEANGALGLCGAQTKILGGPIGTGRLRYEAWLNSLISYEEITREIFVECPLAHPTFFIRRDAFADVGGYHDRGWPEDYDLIMRLWLAGWQLAKVPETLLLWRHSPKRLSATDPRYDEAAFRALKRHYLFQTFLHKRPVFHQWGAGDVGKRWLQEWREPPPAAVVDIAPRKVGKTIHGVPVIAPEDLPSPSQTFIVVAVGARGAREEIRAWLNPRGYQETIDYIFLA